MSNVEWSMLVTKEMKDAAAAKALFEQKAQVEDAWRGRELEVVARQLEAIEEDEAEETPPDLLPGTRKQWLKYRGQVSNWKTGADRFPDQAGRPVRPM